jgi:hypothetical protein
VPIGGAGLLGFDRLGFRIQIDGEFQEHVRQAAILARLGQLPGNCCPLPEV